MADITCVLGLLCDGVELPPLPLTLSGMTIPEHFSTGSTGDINLVMEAKPLNRPIDPGLIRTDAFGLHTALRQLTGNPMTPGRVHRIAVIFAGHYVPKKTAFGIMFDRGFDTQDDPSTASRFHAVPREGCAVFLGAIKEAYPDDQEQYHTEALFTTIHELGHVFNLTHKESPPSFMANSPISRPFDSMAHHFNPAHQELLAQCTSSDHIWPGGSQFKDRGHLANQLDPSMVKLPPLDFGLELRIDMQQREFWPFEPVELDLRLAVANGIERSYRVPDAIDPGYSEFVVWIEEPSGERRFYRPPHYYCTPRRQMTVSPTKPFERDISIFGQSGGYTFRHSGIHRIWTELTIPRRGYLCSNVLEVNVLPAQQRNAHYRAMQDYLGNSYHSKFLYYRFGHPRRDAVNSLTEFCQNFGSTLSATAVHYAIGRALLKTAVDGSVQAPSRQAQETATEHLRIALDQAGLSPHRRAIAQHLVANHQGKRLGKKSKGMSPRQNHHL